MALYWSSAAAFASDMAPLEKRGEAMHAWAEWRRKDGSSMKKLQGKSVPSHYFLRFYQELFDWSNSQLSCMYGYQVSGPSSS